MDSLQHIQEDAWNDYLVGLRLQMVKEKTKHLKASAQILKASKTEKKKYKYKVLGKEFIIYPQVFSPKYFKDTKFFAKDLPIKKGEDFLEIGCGTGIVSIFMALKGAKKVVATDINPHAVKNAKENIKKYKLEKKITVRKGSLFQPIKKEERFDAIFWNTPFGYIKRRNLSYLEKALFDTEYKLTEKFIKQTKRFLKPNGRLLIGFSSTMGDIGELKRLLKKYKYKFKVLKQIDSTEIHPAKFEIIEGIPY